MQIDQALKGRSLLSLHDLSNQEMLDLVDLAMTLRARRQSGERGDLLRRKSIAMLFEKMSTRTRCAAAVAASDEGGTAEYLAANEIHLGKKESVADTARVLGRMFDGILFRGYRQAYAEALARFSGVPVWNGLTDDCHPTQALADLMTIRERFGRLKGLKVVYVGDGRNNVANSLMLACAKAGIHFVNCTPRELSPGSELVASASGIAGETGGSVSIVHDATEGVSGANVVYTDVWVSMGEESKQAERLALLRPYQVNMDLMAASGNADNGELIFLHCLPAFHDANTEVTRETGVQEVTDEVFESPMSRVFDQAENRMHTIKALFVAMIP